MNYTIGQLLWLFLIYSFLGWMGETVAAGVKKRHLANRGLINGPLCIIYGFSAVLLSVVSGGLSVFWIFVGSAVVSTVVEWTGGHLIEKYFHERWWDYSGNRLNLDGYICVPASLLWGTLGTLAVKFGNRLFCFLYDSIPVVVGRIILLALFGVLAVDILASVIVLSGRSHAQEKWQNADDWLTGISNRFGKWLCARADRRITKAYPVLKVKKEAAETAEESAKECFAKGCCFYKIFLLFFIGSFIGDIVETIFCRIFDGVWMSRSSLVWGPFSVVWGLAIAAATALLYKYRNRSDRFLFMVGVVVGGTYEYVCSVFTEIVFGKIFWDYSHMPFNLGGRINLLYCFFWGIAAVVWFKKIYVVLSGFIEKWPVKVGKIITWILVVFMLCNIVVSCMALIRYEERGKGMPAVNGLERTLDAHFDDARMEWTYPNAKEAK